MVADVTDSLEDLALSYPCGYCGAAAEEWCVARPSGLFAQFLHNARMKPLYKAYWLGLSEEEDNLMDSYWNHHDWFVRHADRWADKAARSA